MHPLPRRGRARPQRGPPPDRRWLRRVRL